MLNFKRIVLWVAMGVFCNSTGLSQELSLDSLLVRALKKYQTGNNHAALMDYNVILERQPNHFEALVNRGNVLKAIRDYVGALKDYEKALTIKPDDPEIYYNQGNSYYAITDDKKALQAYDKSIALKPDFALAYYNRALCKYNLKDIKGMCQDLTKAAELGYAAAHELRDQHCGPYFPR